MLVFMWPYVMVFLQRYVLGSLPTRGLQRTMLDQPHPATTIHPATPAATAAPAPTDATVAIAAAITVRPLLCP